ncbi:Cell division protein FtsA [Candidatus Trichorickettsia mobilis]|uniref:Cell division protein FtsA n=1 Tax=Candidatus Trichorickettsia mobilis TaxID=1346319 RepID=A0ABZ0UTQ7_9RICK|nr:cell division protein FtsA [Candidatus Trichorickettsia mobilis]WPY01425.1 Cell division protein FtsA [Candidatus Trichorickettsia mobilis]
MKAKLLNFVALDLGSSKIAAIAAHIDKKSEIKILSHNLHHAVGIKSGVITDLQAAESSIINAIYAIEKDCNKNIKRISISLSGAGTKSHYTNHKIKLSGSQITIQDIKKLLQKMLVEFKVKDQEIIHYFPVEFLIDDHHIVENPIGMFGKELSCRLHIITASSNVLINLTNCLAKCHIEVSNIILSIYATGIACLSNDEKNLGAIIIDIGAKTTAVGIFLANKLIYSNYITIGSWHITNDIAKVFSVNINTAEKLKILYGSALLSPFEPDIPLRIEEFEPDNQYNPNMVISVSQLTAVINPRIEEILSMVKQQCDQAAVDYLIARRIVLAGGGAALKSIRELASTVFERPVRISKPNGLAEIETSNLEMYATAIGMVTDHAHRQQKNSLNLHNINENSSWFKKTLIWLKANL